MTSKERTFSIFESRMPDRVPVFDEIDKSTLDRWAPLDRRIRQEGCEICFGFDIAFFAYDDKTDPGYGIEPSFERVKSYSGINSIIASHGRLKDAEKFLALKVCEPFEHLCRMRGREEVLAMIIREPRAFRRFLRDSLDFNLTMCELILDKGYTFDAAWLSGDLGYGRGPYFSLGHYTKFLYDLHREACAFFETRHLPVVFHSHGNITEFLPSLVKSGIRGLEPLECGVGLDLERIKAEYGKDIVLIGGIDQRTYVNLEKAKKEIKVKLKVLSGEGGYIYRADGPVTEDVRLDHYKEIVEYIKVKARYD